MVRSDQFSILLSSCLNKLIFGIKYYQDKLQTNFILSFDLLILCTVLIFRLRKITQAFSLPFSRHAWTYWTCIWNISLPWQVTDHVKIHDRICSDECVAELWSSGLEVMQQKRQFPPFSRHEWCWKILIRVNWYYLAVTSIKWTF